jgi:hypothetical protein
VGFGFGLEDGTDVLRWTHYTLLRAFWVFGPFGYEVCRLGREEWCAWENRGFRCMICKPIRKTYDRLSTVLIIVIAYGCDASPLLYLFDP